MSQEGLVAILAQTAVLPSTTVTVAESVRVQVSANSKSAIEISGFTAPTLDNAQILKTAVSKSVASSQGGFDTSIDFDVMPLAPGELEFPSLRIEYKLDNQKLEFFSPPAKMLVVNPYESGQIQVQPRDIKGPVPAGMSPWVPGIIFLALAATAAVFWFLKKQKKFVNAEVSKEPPRPAHEIAFEKLSAAMESYRKNLDSKMFYSDLSLILREYLGARFGMDAVEKTTAEIFYDMKSQGLEMRFCMGARDILSSSDLVKFAKFLPTEKDLELDWARARQFVEDAKA